MKIERYLMSINKGKQLHLRVPMQTFFKTLLLSVYLGEDFDEEIQAFRYHVDTTRGLTLEHLQELHNEPCKNKFWSTLVDMIICSLYLIILNV